MSLLRRTSNNMSNQSNQNTSRTQRQMPPPTAPNQGQSSNQNQKPSPFGRGPSSSSSSSSSSSQSGSPSNSNNPFGNWRKRLNNANQQVLEWSVSPFSKVAVRFQLGGLGDPFHRLLGTDLDVELGNPQKVVELLQADDDLRTQLEAVLEEAWNAYGFRGAALMHPWNEGIRKALVHHPLPVDPPKKEESSDDEEEDLFDDDKKENPFASKDSGTRQIECLRAIDLGLVLNVLARVRSEVLVEQTPLALDPGFLDQAYVTDDPRLVAIARATGCIEETW